VRKVKVTHTPTLNFTFYLVQHITKYRAVTYRGREIQLVQNTENFVISWGNIGLLGREIFYEVAIDT
jgi:hypothetical protein